jgi:dTMP kinase
MIRLPGGILVAIEGIDGAGKTTVATFLTQFCGERGIACTLSKEPTGLKWGTELRRSASEGRLTMERETELFELDRRDHVERTIRPALSEGNVVILDRYYWSNAAYQGVKGAYPTEILQRNESFAPVPDLFILLDLEEKAGIERIRLRGDKPNLFESEDNLKKVRDIFIDLSQNSKNCAIIDANRPLKIVAEEALLVFKRALISQFSTNQEVNPSVLNTVLALLH